MNSVSQGIDAMAITRVVIRPVMSCSGVTPQVCMLPTLACMLCLHTHNCAVQPVALLLDLAWQVGCMQSILVTMAGLGCESAAGFQVQMLGTNLELVPCSYITDKLLVPMAVYHFHLLRGRWCADCCAASMSVDEQCHSACSPYHVCHSFVHSYTATPWGLVLQLVLCFSAVALFACRGDSLSESFLAREQMRILL